MQHTKGFWRHLPASMFFAFCIALSPAPAENPVADSGEIHGTVYQRGSEHRLASASVRLTETE